MAFAPGQTVGEYEILTLLGAGGMGRVYRVRNVISQRVEAMKVLLPDFTAEPGLAARFIAEIRTLASLDHPNIAQLHTAFQVDNQLVMMMEFVEGFTLEQRAKQGPIPPGEVIEYTLQILSALSYAHSRGVIHRDIKPANAMVTSHGVVKLMDFGIAKSRTENQLTQPGTTLGSVYYMSPEQVRGATVDARSDLYSIGILLYELLSGRRPFEGDTTYGILNQQLNTAPRPPIELNPQLPRQLNDLILLALAKDPAQRFQSADAFRNALCISTGRTPSAPPQPGFSAAPAPLPLPPAAAAAAAPPPAASSESVTESVPWSPVTPAPAGAPLPARPSGSSRAVWVSVGALTVVALLAAAAIGLPHFFRTGASSAESPVQTAQATPSRDPGPATPTPSGNSGTSFAVAAAASAAPASPAAQPPSSEPPRTTSPRRSKETPRPTYTSDHPQPAAPAATPPSQTAAAQPVPASGPSPQELDQARDRKLQLDARAGAVSASLENLRRLQEADGYGLRQDIAAAASRMHTYLQAASAAINSGDIAAAQRDLDRADKEISTLEDFFNK